MNKRHIIFITIAVTRFLKFIADSLFRNGKFVLIQAKYIDCMAVRPVYDTVFSKKTESIEDEQHRFALQTLHESYSGKIGRAHV